MGSEVLVPEQELKELEEQGFYFYQIEGSSVFTKEGALVGKVTDMLAIPENDLLVVDRDGKEVLIPFTSDICIRVDAEMKRIIVDPPQGLLELDEI